jgi:CO/xanthine dehydrogenase Mo-binding subunit
VPTTPVAPAIANAVQDAVGERVRELPITAQKVYEALQASSRK